MLDEFIKAIDRTIDLLNIRELRARLRYKLVYAPAFAELERIHCDYLGVFAAVRLALASVTGDTFATQIRSAATLVRERSVSLQPTRRKIASLAAPLLQSLKHVRPCEQQFLEAMSSYFTFASEFDATLRAESWLQNPNERGRLGLVDEGGYPVGMGTPFSSLLEWLEFLETGMRHRRGAVRHPRLFARNASPDRPPYSQYSDHPRSIVINIDRLMVAADREWAKAAAAFQKLQLELIAHATKEI